MKPLEYSILLFLFLCLMAVYFLYPDSYRALEYRNYYKDGIRISETRYEDGFIRIIKHMPKGPEVDRVLDPGGNVISVYAVSPLKPIKVFDLRILATPAVVLTLIWLITYFPRHIMKSQARRLRMEMGDFFRLNKKKQKQILSKGLKCRRCKTNPVLENLHEEEKMEILLLHGWCDVCKENKRLRLN